MGKTALLIIDMQNDFCLSGAPFEVNGAMDVAVNIKDALEASRKHKLPIIYVIRHYRSDGSDVEITRYEKFVKKGGGLVKGTHGAEIVEMLKPQGDEYIITKRRWSAFFQTELAILLKRLGVDQVVITGVQTPNCIRGTAWDANSLDYEVIVLNDGTGASAPEVHEANLYDMKNIGIKLMSTKEFINSLPNPPKDNLVLKIREDIEREILSKRYGKS